SIMGQVLPWAELMGEGAASRLADRICDAIKAGKVVDSPFFHLVFDRIFPDDVYATMLAVMPVESDYRPMHGRSKGHDLADGTHTRVKIDLFPEYIRNLPPEKRIVWTTVGCALRSEKIEAALVCKLAPPLARRFGADFAKVGMYPLPVLTRDIPGYRITPHTDKHWTGITLKVYLPRDASATHVGTIFHVVGPNGALLKAAQMKFAPNTGYAFVVGDDTWHSADPVGPEVTTRDSILLTYFVDAGALRFLRNRGKRLGNFVLNELRYILRRRSRRPGSRALRSAASAKLLRSRGERPFRRAPL